MTGNAALPETVRRAGAAIKIAAPMKINLGLHILGKTAGGYHDLESLVAFSPAGDALYFCPAARDSFSISGLYAAQLSHGGDNLALRARDSLRALLGAAAVPPAAIHLEKNLPVAAGLGGGSADAAACFIGLCALSGLQPEHEPLRQALMERAAALGADVPMCLAWFFQKSAFIARGLGEKLSVLPHFPALPLVAVNDGAALSTAAVFARLEKAENPPMPKNWQEEANAPAMDFAACLRLLRQLRNDLYPPALQAAPQLAEILAQLRRSGAAYAAMSGSGASCFGIYPSMAAAETAAAFIRRQRPQFFVLTTQTDGAPLAQS